MSLYLETRFPGEPLLQLAQVAICEVLNGAALGAHDVVVVLTGSPHKVASSVACGVNLADEAEPVQYVEGAVHCNQSYSTMLPLCLPVYIGRGEMVVAEVDSVEHGAALRRELVALPPDYALDALARKIHLAW